MDPAFIYASNEPKSVLAGDCRDNLRNSRSVFLIVDKWKVMRCYYRYFTSSFMIGA